MSNAIETARATPYDNQTKAFARRAAQTSRTASHTAASAERAYGRASIPAHVVRGRIAKTTPEVTATVREENCLPSTTIPAAAPPIARPLGARDQNSVGGKSVNQPCMSR